MLNSSWKVFLLTALVLLLLLFLQLVPPISLLGIETRRVDMMGDVMDPKENSVAEKDSVKRKTRKQNEGYELYQPEGVTLFEDFSKGEEGGLDHFMALLADSMPTDRTVNIAYYGDSFIEGDILTGDLRELLQAQYGGSGPGWVEVGPNFGSFRPTASVTWSNVAERCVVKGGFDPSLQGPAQRYYLLSRYAAFNVKGTNRMPHVGRWNRALLFLRAQVSSSLMMGYNKGKMTVKPILPSQAVQTFVMQGDMQSVQYGFGELPQGIQVFGVALDGANGIALDNFSMRGIPGYSIAMLPVTTMHEIARYRPYDLVILHYGLNAVGAKTSELEMANYISRMENAVEHIKTACPNASILVVSVPDRDQRTAAGIHTIPMLKKLVESQRKMAQRQQVGFFNLFEAMGGDDSMATLVNSGQANKDYTHLNFKGGETIARLFYEAILAGVENYYRRTTEEGGER